MYHIRQAKHQTSLWLLAMMLILFFGICGERLQTDYRLYFPQNSHSEAMVRGASPGTFDETLCEETSLKTLSSEVFRQEQKRSSTKPIEFLRILTLAVVLLLPLLPLFGISFWIYQKYVIPSIDTIIWYIHQQDGKKGILV